MRNLKRALSLTLASVMLLGMMVVGTSAASFPDVTEEDNVEAIEVLAAVKVLQGYDDGQYHAENPVTRNQMATIICRMMGWRDSDYAGLNTFPDVPDWAANYVAACAANGIINGRDDGRFHGDDTVTATEAASMMLRALGYTRMPVGADWARAVAQQASKINLFDQLNVGAYTALTRGDVAQLSLNTMQSTLVDVEDDTLNISGGTSDNPFNISGGQIKYVVRTAAYNDKMAQAIKANNNPNAGGIDGTSGQTIELGEQVFGGDLRRRANQTDDMGRPAVTWVYKNSTVGTYAEAVEHTVYVPYASTAKTVTKMIEDIDKSYKIVGATTILVNGDDTDLKTGAYVPAVGDRLEVFMDSANTGNVKTIAITHWRVDKMTGDAATRADGSDTQVRLPGVRGLSTFNSDNTTETVHGWQGLVEDDIVLVYQDNDDNYWVEKAESFTGILTSVEGTGSSNRERVTIEGQKYEKSGATNFLNGDTDRPLTFNKNEATWYLDKGGNIVWVVGKEVAEVAYVVAFGSKADEYGSATNYAKLLTTDGTVLNVVTKKNYTGATTSPSQAAFSVGEVVKYEKDGDKYVLTKISGGNDSFVAKKNTAAGPGGTPAAVTELNTAVIQKKNPNVTATTGTSFATNGETVFMIRQYDGANGTDNFTLYTGYNNVPTLKGANSDFAATAYLSAYIGSNGYAKYVYVDAGQAVNASADDLFYVVSDAVTTHAQADGTYNYSVKGVRKGGEGIEDIIFATTPSVTKNTGYTITSYNSDGEVSGYTAITDGGKYYVGSATGKTTGDGNGWTINMGGQALRDDNAEIWLINEDGNKAEKIESSMIEKDNNDAFLVVRDSATTSEAGYYTAKVVFIREIKDAPGQLPQNANSTAIENMLDQEGEATVTNANISGGVTVEDGETLNLNGTTSDAGTVTAEAGSKINVGANLNANTTIATEAGATVTLSGDTTVLPKITGNGTIEVSTTIDSEGHGNVGDLDNMVVKLGVTPVTGTSASTVNFTRGVQFKGGAELIDYSSDLTVNEIVAKWAGTGETASSTVSMQVFKIAAADLTADVSTIKAYYTTKTTVPDASATGEGWTAVTLGYGSTNDKVVSTGDLGGGDLEIVVPVGDKVTAVMYVVDKDGAGANAATTYIFKAN